MSRYRLNLYGLQDVQRVVVISNTLSPIRARWRQENERFYFSRWQLYREGLLWKEGLFHGLRDRLPYWTDGDSHSFTGS